MTTTTTSGRVTAFQARLSVAVVQRAGARSTAWGELGQNHAMQQICEDLAAEHAALDAIVADLTEEQWRTPTPAEGWDVADTIVHILQADLAALQAVVDPDSFEAAKRDMVEGRRSLQNAFGTRAGRTGAEVLAWWRDSRTKMLAAFRPLGPKDRIPWFGPSMSALSFATARLMETWAHGQDIASALHRRIEATDRLRHVCHIGVTTRGWSYVNRGLAVPEGDVRVELRSPSGELWVWGPDGAAARVRGSALDFCLVTTQRRPARDTGLICDGDLAVDWINRAQAFAGPPTNTDSTRAGLL
jgi:uncharacterized protein (TIGR03084 family)